MSEGSSNKETYNIIIFLGGLWLVLNSLFVIHYLMYFELYYFKYAQDIKKFLVMFHEEQRIFRFLMTALVFVMSLLNPRRKKYRKMTDQQKMTYRIGAGIATIIFSIGFWGVKGLDVVVTVPIALATYYLVWMAGQTFKKKYLEDEVSKLDFQNVDGEDLHSFVKYTDKGKLVFPEGMHGFFITGAPGSGKTVVIVEMLAQYIRKGFSGLLYDFEGDPTVKSDKEKPMTLTRSVYSLLKEVNSNIDEDGLVTYEYMKDGKKVKYKDKPVEFGFINFTDLSLTEKCNPFNLRYHPDETSVEQLVAKLMLAVDKELQKKTDFWGKNGINYAQICAIRLKRINPKYLTIPHLVTVLLSPYELVLRWLKDDPYTLRKGAPIMGAFDTQGSGGQLAGSTSSGQVPLLKLYDKRIFYVFNPLNDEEDFDLRISNRENPKFLCLGNSQRYKEMLEGPISIIISNILTNLNELGNRDALVKIDEYNTVTLNADQISEFTGTARKKGVVVSLGLQARKQSEDRYGKTKGDIIEFNLSNRIVGKTPDKDIAKDLMEKIGKKKVVKTTVSTSSSGVSESETHERINELEIGDITNQGVGHFAGEVSNGTHKYFYCQFDYFQLEKEIDVVDELPQKEEYIDGSYSLELLEEEVELNFQTINNQIDELFEPYRQQILEEQEAKNKKGMKEEWDDDGE